MFLIDTSVLSHAKRGKRNRNVQIWISKQEAIAIPFSAILEIQQGIHLVKQSNPDKAIELQGWLDAVLESDFVFPPITQEVARTLATLNCCGPLKTLWSTNSQKRMPGQDLFVAAIAIVHHLPIATLDMADFVLIDQYFPLPGVYHPGFNIWLVQPEEHNCLQSSEIWSIGKTG